MTKWATKGGGEGSAKAREQGGRQKRRKTTREKTQTPLGGGIPFDKKERTPTGGKNRDNL